MIINTIMGPSFGQSFVITAIKEEKTVKRNRIISITCNADKKKRNTNITLLAIMNLLAFGRAKIFGVQRSRVQILHRPEFFSGLIFITS